MKKARIIISSDTAHIDKMLKLRQKSKEIEKELKKIKGMKEFKKIANEIQQYSEQGLKQQKKEREKIEKFLKRKGDKITKVGIEISPEEFEKAVRENPKSLILSYPIIIGSETKILPLDDYNSRQKIKKGITKEEWVKVNEEREKIMTQRIEEAVKKAQKQGIEKPVIFIRVGKDHTENLKTKLRKKGFKVQKFGLLTRIIG